MVRPFGNVYEFDGYLQTDKQAYRLRVVRLGKNKFVILRLEIVNVQNLN